MRYWLKVVTLHQGGRNILVVGTLLVTPKSYYIGLKLVNIMRGEKDNLREVRLN